ncbi:hypothetical protein HO133_009241 [Letharia lupina]|uniref:DUF6594 domain-containing protein n=1 Tax=Letharia lupina TaxID=560253 RepID=A0A8H6CMY9_9LECA|nr:uncharacterized protein HO133_009241 [Letharia lupina]KAF6226375.1 hypothetical protein HO133_009241 [Letharia lupina]
MELKSYEARPGKPRRAYDTRRQPRQLAHHAEAHQTCWYQMSLTQRSLATKGDPKAIKSNRMGGSDSERQTLLNKIKEKLKEYDELMFHIQRVQAIRRPTETHQNALYGQITHNIAWAEHKWICQYDDLAALSSDTEHGWFNVFLEGTLNKISRNALLHVQDIGAYRNPKANNVVQAIFRTPEQNTKTGSKTVDLVSPGRLDFLLRAILTVLAASLLLFPVLILFELQTEDPSKAKSRSRLQILVVFLFTLAFSTCCSLFTKARKQEVFTATAAYSAVLVVFLSNTSYGGTTPSSAR